MSEPQGPIRILHVDDDPDVADTTAAFLEREDERFAVETAANAAEALDRLSDDVDCIVSDYDMPGRNGIDLLRVVREDRPNLPFLLYTGKGSEEVASDAISAGVTDYLQKQPGVDQYALLANRIGNAVDQYRSRRALEGSQKRLSLFIEQSPLGVVEWDDDFEVVRMNDAAEEILGYAEAELKGRSWETIVPESDRDDVEGVVSELLEAKGGYHSVNENVRKDGERIVCEWHNRVVTGEDGETVAIFSQFQDVTERKEHEERLRKTTARLEALFENSPDMINVHDDAGNIIDPNPRLCEETGYSEAELAEMKVWDLDQTIEPEAARRLWAEMAVGDRQELEGVFRRRDGSTFPVEVHVRRLDLEGEARFIVISRAITERKERERELRATTQRLQATIDAAPDAIMAIDDEGRVDLWNPAAERMFGWTEAEVLGEYNPIVPAERRAEFEEFFDQVMAGDPITGIETERRTKDGERIDVSLSTAPIRDERREVAGVVGILTDITERKERERTLRQLHEASRDLLSVDTKEAVAEVISEAVRDTLGYDNNAVRYVSDDGTELAVVAKTEGITEVLGERPVYPVGAGTAGRAYAEQETLLYDDVRTIDDGYDRGDARAGMYLPIGDHGTLSINDRTAGAFDESDVRLAEIFASNAEAVLDSIEQTEALKNRNERLDEFVHIVSHDLRNPLNVAEGNLELARAERDDEYLDTVARAHERMRALIDDLLTLAREGVPVEETEPVALADLIEACWRNVETADATLVAETDGAIRVDRSRFQQLLENLIRNAVEHGGPDVTVRIGTLDGRDGFYVADDGPGIPPGERETVFESGYSTAEGGTGFGLAIANGIAEAHGWEIGVTESDEGGARFEVTGVAFVDG